MHGISEQHMNRFIHSTITIQRKKTHIKNVACELMECLDGLPSPTNVTLNLKDYMAHCVGGIEHTVKFTVVKKCFLELKNLNYSNMEKQ